MILQDACAEQSRRKKYEQNQQERSRNLNLVPVARVKSQKRINNFDTKYFQSFCFLIHFRKSTNFGGYSNNIIKVLGG